MKKVLEKFLSQLQNRIHAKIVNILKLDGRQISIYTMESDLQF